MHQNTTLDKMKKQVYSRDSNKRLGMTSGIHIEIQHDEEKKGDRYEVTFNFYFGDYGHIALQRPCITYWDTFLAVMGCVREDQGPALSWLFSKSPRSRTQSCTPLLRIVSRASPSLITLTGSRE
ncbi:hypothetical protein MLD38_001246 [Melastoma candidum]|uniref:Uncharacterized protein n=1 Tax=Melastoma candidum TaxID=119954 RepID=A0ACB9SBZ4_9MYRT|nr:hypothetical protein MLD38_001246 [Melastoma candidum]